jgi:hypothetical protein
VILVPSPHSAPECWLGALFVPPPARTEP